MKGTSYPDLEVLPIDDVGPRPATDVIEEFARGDPRWRPILHSRNLGLAGTLNDGLRNATGSHVLVLQQDCELIAPDAIERAVDILKHRPKWCLTGTPMLPFDDMRRFEIAFAIARKQVPPSDSRDGVPTGFSELKCDLFPREALEAAGGFDERFHFSGEDQVLSHRLQEAGWNIVRSSALAYVMRQGGRRTVGASLRKEFVYGRTQAAVLLRTGLGALRTSRESAQGHGRLANRLGGWLAGTALVALPFALFLTGLPSLAVALLALPIARIGIVLRRAIQLAPRIRRPLKVAALAALLVLPDDVVYAIALSGGIVWYAVKGRA